MTTAAALAHARAVADAVLYEGYLLYPYRSSSQKNQARWQFGVLGPPGAADAGLGEGSGMAVQCLVRPRGPQPRLTVQLRFLQLQHRSVERLTALGWASVAELSVGDATYLTWDEAVEHELAFGPFPLDDLTDGTTLPVALPGGADVEELRDEAGARVGRLVRRRWALRADLALSAVVDDGVQRVEVAVDNAADPLAGMDATNEAAIRTSLIGAHLLLAAADADFVSVIDPPADAAGAAARCTQRRCWPVLAGAAGATDVVLGSPIILYDHPEVAPESAGALFDSTEIDEILTLRVLTLTDAEKADARATDARAAAIIDRCEQMSPEQLQLLHGVLRDPHGADAPDRLGGAISGTLSEDLGDLVSDLGVDPEVPWWDPATDASVRPDRDAVLVAGTPVSRGSVVRVHPTRRADAQDLFFAGQTARVTAVHRDVDGQTHVAVVLVDDPAADLHDWYGRYLYFAPDELEPIAAPGASPGPSSHEGYPEGEEGLR